MNAILQYVLEKGFFSPPQTIGGYDDVPFTHAEFGAYVNQLTENNAFKDVSDLHPAAAASDVVVLLLSFEVDGKFFVLRHLEMGEHVDQIWDKEVYDKTYPGLDPPCQCGHSKDEHNEIPIDPGIFVCSKCNCATQIWMDPERRRDQEETSKRLDMDQKIIVGTKEDILWFFQVSAKHSNLKIKEPLDIQLERVRVQVSDGFGKVYLYREWENSLDYDPPRHEISVYGFYVHITDESEHPLLDELMQKNLTKELREENEKA